MNIIFGDAATEIAKHYTVLELDTVEIASSQQIKTFCVVDKIPLTEFAQLESYKKIHHDMIQQYRNQNWEFCRRAIDSLLGKFNGELDSFYQEILSRVNTYQTNPPGNNWNWAIKQKSK